ncbi:unnamed protein product [Brassica napus]|uniref:(rape) hypothetical protein n=1 Tax=Brassica napus TaxID=3708 RepID=A0A816IBN5_BRANA|nr:unnamed protein product [Brassica napus]
MEKRIENRLVFQKRCGDGKRLRGHMSLSKTTVCSSPTIPSSASISSPSSVTLFRIKGIAFFCSVFSRIPSLRSSLIELLHDDLEAYQSRSSRISRTSVCLLLTPSILRPRRR